MNIESRQCVEALNRTTVGLRNCTNVDSQRWTFTTYTDEYRQVSHGSSVYTQQYSVFKELQHQFKSNDMDRKSKLRT